MDATTSRNCCRSKCSFSNKAAGWPAIAAICIRQQGAGIRKLLCLTARFTMLAARWSEPMILVTGAAGFIGFSVVRRLLDRGEVVVGLDNLNAYYDPELKRARLAQLERRNGFTFHQVDLS